jgi:hypothetical protein
LAAPVLHRCFRANHPAGAAQLSNAEKDAIVAEVNHLLSDNGLDCEVYTKPKLDCWTSNQLYRWRAAEKRGAKPPKPARCAAYGDDDPATPENAATPGGTKREGNAISSERAIRPRVSQPTTSAPDSYIKDSLLLLLLADRGLLAPVP